MANKQEEDIKTGLRVKIAREAAGLTQEELAECLSMTPQYISGVERGIVGLSVPVLRRLSDVLLVPCDALIKDEIEISDVTSIESRLSRLPGKHAQIATKMFNCYCWGIALASKDEDADTTEDEQAQE